MFKRSASRAGLKEALALRSERKIERLREIERFEKESKPTRGSSTNSYFGSDRDRASPEVTRNLAGVHYALWEVKEEAFIRSMAAKVLQHRWRLIRCSPLLSRPAPLSVPLSVCLGPASYRVVLFASSFKLLAVVAAIEAIIPGWI